MSQMSHASQHVTTANPATVELSPSPFPAEWVLEGRPQARATAIAHSRDGAMTVIAWSCTKGRFRWQYHVDEMAHILSGEVVITDQSGTERRLGPGDTVFFPAGSSSVWQVIRDVRKVAVCHVAVPKPVGLALRIWSKLGRTVREVLGLDAEADASDGGLMGGEPLSVPQAHSAAPPG
ncbi:MAG TPA: cupin domain-containing protein [Xanthobacteraceae bacterium]|nr:cupin domain-containing protein [Xanthobacteraceae bacterium]